MSDNGYQIWVVVDANGDYAVGTDRGEALENYEANISGSIDGCRLVQIFAHISPPTDTSVDVHVPDDAGEIVTVESEDAR